MTTTRKEAWAYLSRVIEGPSLALQNYLRQGMDVEEIAHGVKIRSSHVADLLSATASRYEWDEAKQDLEQIEKLGGRLVTPDDAEWPKELFDTAFGFSESIAKDRLTDLNIQAAAPTALWVKGRNLNQILGQALAIVGTRAATSYGERAVSKLVAELARSHWTIISGGAIGIDTLAHTTAIHEGLPTIAVFASGLDQHYPLANRKLFQQIPRNGALVSEYPPGVRPARHRFLSRNRLVAALGRGVVTVEAAYRSGALNTLNWADALGRVSMCVPGPITSIASGGCHQRIADHAAALVASGKEIEALLLPVGAVDYQPELEFTGKNPELPSLPFNQLRVYDALPRAGEDPVGAEVVAIGAGFSLDIVMQQLIALERKGLVFRRGTKWGRQDLAVAQVA